MHHFRGQMELRLKHELNLWLQKEIFTEHQHQEMLQHQSAI